MSSVKTSYSPRRYQPSSRSIMSAPAGASRDRSLMQATSSRREAFTCIPGVRPNYLHRNQSLGGDAGSTGRKSVSQLSIIDSTSGGMKRMSITSKTSAEKYNSQYFSRQASVDSRRASATVRLPRLRLEHVDNDSSAEKHNGGIVGKNEENNDHNQSASPEVVTETIKDLNDKDATPVQTPRTVANGVHGAEVAHRKSILMPNNQGHSAQGEPGVSKSLCFHSCIFVRENNML